MRIAIWSVLFIPLLLGSCLSSDKKDKDIVLAEVNKEKILLKEALINMPDGFVGTDSVNFVQEYLANRIKDMLVYEKAVKTISGNSEIDSLVESYRRSLIVYEYQQQLLNSEVKSEVREEELMDFYKKNISRFFTDQNLVKGIFLKVDKDASNIEKLRQWCRKPNSEALDKIESYSVQNAVIYNYFMDKWTVLEEVAGSMPLVSNNPSAYLKPGNTVETEDDEYCYLLYVKDCILRGQTAPIEHVRPLVLSVMVNNKKSDILRKYEQDLLDKAIKGGKVIYY